MAIEVNERVLGYEGAQYYYEKLKKYIGKVSGLEKNVATRGDIDRMIARNTGIYDEEVNEFVLYSDFIGALKITDRGKEYKLGDISFNAYIPSWGMLQCIKDGVTNENEIQWEKLTEVGQTIEDGTVTWKLVDLRPSDENARGGINLLTREKKYEIGDIAYHENLKSYLRLECTKAGTTGDKEPDGLEELSAEDAITDGTVEWIAVDVRDNSMSEEDLSSLIIKLIEDNGHSLKDWESEKEYVAGDLVLFDNAIYKCVTENNDEIFDKNNWIAISSKGRGNNLFTIDEDGNVCLKNLDELNPEDLETDEDTIKTLVQEYCKIYGGSLWEWNGNRLKPKDRDSLTLFDTSSNSSTVRSLVKEYCKIYGGSLWKFNEDGNLIPKNIDELDSSTIGLGPETEAKANIGVIINDLPSINKMKEDIELIPEVIENLSITKNNIEWNKGDDINDGDIKLLNNYLVKFTSPISESSEDDILEAIKTNGAIEINIGLSQRHFFFIEENEIRSIKIKKSPILLRKPPEVLKHVDDAQLHSETLKVTYYHAPSCKEEDPAYVCQVSFEKPEWITTIVSDEALYDSSDNTINVFGEDGMAMIKIDMSGYWELAIPGVDYSYSYKDDETMSIKFLASGDYKVNYESPMFRELNGVDEHVLY